MNWKRPRRLIPLVMLLVFGGVASPPPQAYAVTGDATVYRRCNGGADLCGVLIREFRFDKVWDDHKIGRWFVGETAIQATLNRAIETDSPTSNAYDYQWNHYDCSRGTCRRDKWVIARVIIEWGDGIDNHGRLVTVYPVAGDRVGNDFPSWISVWGNRRPSNVIG
jgi:hypothetical protein